MINRLSPSNESFLVALNRISARAERAARQISSGYRITVASDAPDDISALLQSRVDLDRATQIKTNLGRVKTEVDTAEQTLSSAVNLLERARVLGVQGASSMQPADARAAAAEELDGVLRRLVSLSNTQVEGRYIFSGDADHEAAYTWDENQAYPVSAYGGAAATRKVQHPSGTAFQVSRPADGIFDAAGKSAFQSVYDLAAALRANDTTAIEASLAVVEAAGDHVNEQLTFYGAAQSQVNASLDDAGKLELRLQTEISGVQETDLTAAILELNQATYHQQAALEARSRLPQTSLFEYLR